MVFELFAIAVVADDAVFDAHVAIDQMAFESLEVVVSSVYDGREFEANCDAFDAHVACAAVAFRLVSVKLEALITRLVDVRIVPLTSSSYCGKTFMMPTTPPYA